MIDSFFRKPYQSIMIQPILAKLSRLNISPHVYTWGALISGVSIIPALYFDLVWIATILLLLSGYLDTLDGSVARAKQNETPRGAVFDIVSDRIVETCIIFGLYLVDPSSRGLICFLMLASAYLCITSFLVVGIFMQNETYKSFYYSPGIMERTEAFIFFGSMILFPSAFIPLGVLFATLVTLTAAIRVWQFSRHEHT